MDGSKLKNKKQLTLQLKLNTFKDSQTEKNYLIYQTSKWNKWQILGFLFFFIHVLFRLITQTTKIITLSKNDNSYDLTLNFFSFHVIMLVLLSMSQIFYYKFSFLIGFKLKILQIFLYYIYFLVTILYTYIIFNIKLESKSDIKLKIARTIYNFIFGHVFVKVAYFENISNKILLIYMIIIFGIILSIISFLDLEIVSFIPDFLILIFIIGLLILFNIVIKNFMRKNFKNISKLKSTKKYYQGFLNNLNLPIISLKNLYPYFVNKKFKQNFKSFTNKTLTHSNINKTCNRKENFKFFLDLFISTTKQISLRTYLKRNLSFYKKPTKCFNKINDIFEFKNKLKFKYYEISLRIFKIGKGFTIDIIFNDITNVKNTEKLNTEMKLKTNLFGKIAHEFKTPIITITSELEVLENNLEELYCKDSSKSLNLDIVKTVKNIKNLSNYTIFLISDIINYATTTNSEAPQQPLNLFKVYNINDILEFSFNISNSLLKYLSGNKSTVKVELDVNSTVKNYFIESNEVKLKQILLNLLSNSVKFTFYGYIKIKCYIIEENFRSKNKYKSNDTKINENNFSFDKRHTNKPSLSHDNIISLIKQNNNSVEYFLCIEIIDTGTGLSQEIINSFNSEDEIRKVNFTNYNNSLGSGLGLGIAKNLSKNNGIKISCKSSIYGTTFRLLMPAYLIQSENRSSCLSSDYSYISNNDEEDNSIITKKYQNKSFDYGFLEERGSNLRVNMLENISNRFSGNEIFNIKSRLSKKSIKDKDLNSIPRQSSRQRIVDDVIIICDDSSIILDSLYRLLLSLNPIKNKYHIIKVNDGLNLIQELISLSIYNKTIKLVISDENMQFINGSHARKVIKDIQIKGRIKENIIFFSLTAFEDENTKQDILNSGFSEVLIKPVNKHVLTEKLEKYNIY